METSLRVQICYNIYYYWAFSSLKLKILKLAYYRNYCTVTETAAILKNRKRPYLCHALTDLHTICRDGAFWPSEGYGWLKFQTFKNPRCWPPFWKIENSHISAKIRPDHAQNLPRPAPIFGSQSSIFHPNGFAFSGVIAESAKAVLFAHGVNPWFALNRFKANNK